MTKITKTKITKVRRQNPTPPLRFAITGAMGMGKSTTAAMFHQLGFPLYDADKEVHALYHSDGLGVAPVAALFPAAHTKDNAIDRAILRRLCADDKAAVAKLEAVVHPLLAAGRAQFLASARHARAVVFDIPLLFETGGEGAMDVVVAASAPPHMQRQRLLARGTMDEAAIKTMLSRQLSDDEKRRRADFIVDTGGGIEAAKSQVADIVRQCLPQG